MVMREYFHISGGNAGLTESIIYWNPPKNKERAVIVYSGSTLETTLLGVVDKETLIKNKHMTIFSAPAIIIVRKGLAGNTKFVEKGQFTINDDAYVITVKEKYRNEINIAWAEKVIQNYANDCITSKGTNGTFSKEQFLNLEFSFPSMQEQNEIVCICKNIDMLKNKMHVFDKRLEHLDHYIICSDTVCKINAGKLFNIRGGNSGLTEEFIYKNQPMNENEAIRVFSSSTDAETNMGLVSRNAQINGGQIKTFQGPAIIISRNGQAGKVTFIEKGTFTINDHAYILTVKQRYQKQVHLEWFSYVAERYTSNCVTSKNSNGTFNKEVFMKEQIDIIDYEMQKEIVEKKRELHTLHAKLKRFIEVFGEKV